MKEMIPLATYHSRGKKHKWALYNENIVTSAKAQVIFNRVFLNCNKLPSELFWLTVSMSLNRSLSVNLDFESTTFSSCSDECSSLITAHPLGPYVM